MDLQRTRNWTPSRQLWKEYTKYEQLKKFFISQLYCLLLNNKLCEQKSNCSYSRISVLFSKWFNNPQLVKIQFKIHNRIFASVFSILKLFLTTIKSPVKSFGNNLILKASLTSLNIEPREKHPMSRKGLLVELCIITTDCTSMATPCGNHGQAILLVVGRKKVFYWDSYRAMGCIIICIILARVCVCI